MSRAPYRSFADAAPKTAWTPVVNPRPSYENLQEKRRYEQALADTPRREDEDVTGWLARVAAAARPVNDRQLPRVEREVGEDG